MPEQVLVRSIECNNEKNSVEAIEYMGKLSSGFFCPKLLSQNRFAHSIVNTLGLRKDKRIYNKPDSNSS